MAELIYPKLSYRLNGIFFEVQNKLGTKFQEKHYVRAVVVLLKRQGIAGKLEVPIIVTIDEIFIGKFRADMIVENKILIEFKATNYLTEDHRKQMLQYLEATNLRLGLLVNFRVRPLQIWRVAN